MSPASVVGLPDTVVNFDLTATNTSNASVDQLIIEDPAEPASNAFDYLEVTGLTNVVFPTGANRVRVDWFDGTTWTTGTAAATATLPPNPSLIKGLRLTFSQLRIHQDRHRIAGVVPHRDQDDRRSGRA